MTFWMLLVVYILGAVLTHLLLLVWIKQPAAEALGLCLVWPLVWVVWLVLFFRGDA